MKLKFLSVPAIILILVPSCAPEAGNDISTHTVTRKNFESTIRVQGFVEPVNVTSVVCPRGVDGIVEWLVEEGTHVEQGDTLCIIDFPTLETNYDQMLTRLEEAKTTLARTAADLAMQYAILEAQVRSNEAESEIARMDSLELAYSTPNQRKIRELQLESALINKVRYEKKLEALKVIQASEIRTREIEIQQLTVQVQTAKEMLDKLTVTAPKAGLVVLPTAWMTGEKLTLGDNVWTNHPIATLPEMNLMKVKITASETDYRQISMSDSVVYRFDAMPDNPAWGKITNRAYQGQPVKRGSQVKTFEIEGSIDSVGVMPEPGYSADCNVIMEELKDVIVVPQIALFDQDSVKVVYVREGRRRNSWEMRQVRTGLASATESVIEQGLDEGETVALMRPAERAVGRRTLLPVADSTAVAAPPVDSIAII